MHRARVLLATLVLSAAAGGGWLWGQQPGVVAQAWAGLADQPATHTSFSFDRSQIQAAAGLLEQGGLDPAHAAAAISSITFDSYHYARPAFYTPEVMATILEDYRHAGWKHLVNAHPPAGNQAQPQAIVTDLWLHFSGAEIDGVNVLLRGPQTMNLIQVAGELRPLDLLHLSGHFGIPQVDPNAVMVPEGSQPATR